MMTPLQTRFVPARSALLAALLAAAAPAQTELYSKYGASAGGHAGRAVAGNADFNGDGFPDFVFGVPEANLTGHTGNGSVRFVDGLTGAGLATLPGKSDFDGLGTSLALAGDVDADGVVDVIAGAPNGDVAGFRAGYARVYSGATFGLLFTLQGFTDGSDFGFSVAGRIDVNNDGHDDLIVGAPLEGSFPFLNGAVYIFSGSSGALVKTINGPAASAFGSSVADAGFVDGDGYRDFIVGRTGGAGAATVYDGRFYSVLHTFNGSVANGLFGAKVEGGFEIDGDGVAELAVSAPADQEGAVRVYSGATGALLATFRGDAGGDQFGFSLSKIGDIDGDGYQELAVGSLKDYVRLVSPAKDAEVLTLAGPAGDSFGVSVGAAGDTNGDGVRDFLVGSTRADSPSGDVEAGRVTLFSSAPWFLSYCTAGTSAGGCQATIAGTGVPSASASSGFAVAASEVEGDKTGLFFYAANGRQANAWGNGTSFQCVVPPVKRGALLAQSGSSGACDGSFVEDLNARWCPSCPKPSHNFGAGAVVQAQFWYRDPQSSSNQTTSLSNALEFVVGP